MTSTIKGNHSIIAISNQRVSALDTHVTAKTEIPIGGKVLKGPAVKAIFQNAIETRQTAATKKGEYNTALADRDAAEADRKVADADLRNWVLASFGPNSTEANDFGYAPKKVGIKSVETKSKAVLLNKATRDARGTIGKKKKLAIKGKLPEPVTVAAQPAAPQPIAAAPAMVYVAPSPAAPPPTPPAIQAGAAAPAVVAPHP